MKREEPKALPDAGIMLVWFGPWRPWIALTLHSFARNKNIDLHIVSPEPPPPFEAANIFYHRFDQDELSRRLGQFLGTDYHLTRAYKFCDFKVVYGYLFPEILGRYRFWGWCDEDIIWGDLDRFLSPQLLDSYDVIATCRTCITGQLALVRQRDAKDGLHLRIPQWKEKLLNQMVSFALDEEPLNDVLIYLESRGEIRVLHRQFQTHDVNSAEWNQRADELELAATGRLHGEFKHGNAIWRDGRIFNEASGEEFAFFHFMYWKRQWAIGEISVPPSELSEWRFSADGISFEPAKPKSRAAQSYLRTYRADCQRARQRARMNRMVEGAKSTLQRITRSCRRRLSLSPASQG